MLEEAETDPQAESELLLRLRRLGIRDSDQLLGVCRTGADRYGLAEVLGVDIREIDCLVNRTDLRRVEGLNDETIELLAGAGINTLQSLAGCSSDGLHSLLECLSEAGQMSSRPSAPEIVRGWVLQARQLQRRVWD